MQASGESEDEYETTDQARDVSLIIDEFQQDVLDKEDLDADQYDLSNDTEEVTYSLIESKANEESELPDNEAYALHVQKTSNSESFTEEVDAEDIDSPLPHKLREEAAAPVDQASITETKQSLGGESIDSSVDKQVIQEGKSLTSEAGTLDESKDVEVDNTSPLDNSKPHRPRLEVPGAPEVKIESNNSNDPSEDLNITPEKEDTFPANEIVHVDLAVEVFSAVNQRSVEPVTLIESVATIPPIEVYNASNENDNAIQVVVDKKRIIITAQQRASEVDTPDVFIENADIALIGTVTELSWTFEIIENLGGDLIHRDRVDQGVNAEDGEQPQEMVVVVSDTMLEVIELLNDLAATIPVTENKDGSKSEAIPLIFTTLDAEDRQIVMESDHAKLLQEFLQVLNVTGSERGNEKTDAPSLDEEVYIGEAKKVIDELRIQINENNLIPTITVSDELITFMEKGTQMIELLKNIAQVTPYSELESKDSVSIQKLLLISGDKEASIDLQSLQKLLMLYSKKILKEVERQSMNYDFAPEEIAHDDSFLKRGYIHSDWFTYQEFKYLMGKLGEFELMEERVHNHLFQSP